VTTLGGTLLLFNGAGLIVLAFFVGTARHG
jgi:hypothetical protein